jgi:transposase
LRQRAVLMLEQGKTHGFVAGVMGVNVRTVAKWSARYRISGLEGLGERTRGRRAGEQMALSEDRQAQVLAAMAGANPDQLQIEGVLWTRQAVRALIEKLFGIALSRQTVGGYLRRWGLTAKKPQRRWAEQDPGKVRAWLESEYPAIKARAVRERAVLLFGDEMGVRAGQTAGRTYSPRGQRAVVKLTGRRFSANVISAVGADGSLVFDIFQGTCDELRFMDFLDKLLAHFPGRKVFLVVDNARFHKTEAVKLWLADHPALELFYLPPYAPELNPDEYLNQDVHAHVAARRPGDLHTLISLTLAYLKTRTRQIVTGYFRAPHVSYAR